MKNFALKTKRFITTKPLLWAAFALPLGQADSWKIIDYGNAPVHQVTFASDSMQIQVHKSAAPIIYSFAKPLMVQALDVKASLQGELPKIPKGLIQGQKKSDDSALRLGLIVRGQKKLNWFQRRIAPKWLLELEKLTPKNNGIKHVQFISTCQQKDLLNKQRNHYLDSSLKEECVTLLKKTGPFTLSKKWAQPLEVLGVWVATDGDDTQSSFNLKIDSIEINHK